jgi:hypothetical protein
MAKWRQGLIRLYAARTYFRVSMWFAMLGKRLSGI